MLNHLPQAFQKFIDIPDIVYLSNMIENDISGGISYASLVKNLTILIESVQQAWPNAFIILATPNPSTSYNTGAMHSVFSQISAWILALPTSNPMIIAENNTSLIFSYINDIFYSIIFKSFKSSKRAGGVRIVLN